SKPNLSSPSQLPSVTLKSKPKPPNWICSTIPTPVIALASGLHRASPCMSLSLHHRQLILSTNLDPYLYYDSRAMQEQSFR
ncbi:hypothetical protein KSS87_003254, partial [Heliosperma pusillum]